ncbi:DUF1349 domain-containing protein [Jeotgalibacillus soli]|uniref:DUF1349 domain-containing protein n=1 Tax=Jeotgalibacillus soli TaxID=889306 RepID=A0A0C2VWC1_9BACL|nr:DUF1349 domain-containing protein [Jeotgalibacillus soli]KIL48283.1 hypothetical protein KP78_17300 [Jeotgalibacillus soli]
MNSFLKTNAKNCRWMSEPSSWSLKEEKLVLTTEEETDFWRKTHYGFERMNAHVFYQEIVGDFEMEVALKMEDPSSLYDQAGLVVMVSENCWLKTSLEFRMDGPSYLGSVVTNNGYSDWATRNYPSAWAAAPLAFKVKRTNGDYQIWAKSKADGETGQYEQLRIARLHEDDHDQPIRIGLYACSPSKNASFTTTFHSWKVQMEVK